MLILLSPSKTLDFDSPAPVKRATRPALLGDAQQLVERLREYPPAQLGKLMGVSEKLAGKVFEYLKYWDDQPKPRCGKQAFFAYQGEVYSGLDAQHFSGAELQHAQQHVRILSGLYGVLRPLDLIQPYRLEMGAALTTRLGRNLYEFWGDRITQVVRKALRAQGDDVLINLASHEYFRALEPEKLAARVIQPTFKDKKNGKYQFVQFFGKRARGQMARFIIERQLEIPDTLKSTYEVNGYCYNADLSTDGEWVFSRDAPQSSQ